MKSFYSSPLFLLFSLILIAGCRNGDSPSSITEKDLLGYWHSELAPNEDYDQERLAVVNDMIGNTGTIHFQPKNKVVVSAVGLKFAGAYQIVGDKVKMALDDNSEMELQVDGTYLLLEQPELSFRYSKGGAPPAEAMSPLEEALKKQLNSSKKDPIQGIWEVRAVNDARGQSLYALQELEEGIVFSFHNDGTYTKHMTTKRKNDGTYTLSGSALVLTSELGTVKNFSIKKLTSQELQFQDTETGIIRECIVFGTE